MSVLFPLGLIAAVLYGSLIPFRIDWTQLRASNLFGLLNVGVYATTVEDLITNVLVYVPIGVAIVVCGEHRGTTRLSRLPLAVTVGAGVSVLAETLQTGITARVASWTDVAFDTVGTAVGALLGAALYGACAHALRCMRRELRDRPFRTAASMLTIGMFLYSLAPFDFITTTADLRASFAKVRWGFDLAHATAAGHVEYSRMVGRLTGAAWFAALGYLLALAARRSGRGSMYALASATKHGFVLAGLIEAMQLFTMSHRFEPAAIVPLSLAATAGACCALMVANDPLRSNWMRQPRLAVPGLASAGLILFQVFAILAASAAPGGRVHSVPLRPSRLQPARPVAGLNASPVGRRAALFDLREVRWIPFEALWHRPMVKAASDVVSTIATYGALGLTLCFVIRRAGVNGVWFAAGFAAALVAVASEVLQARVASRTGDVTGPVLAVLAVIGVFHVYSGLRSQR